MKFYRQTTQYTGAASSLLMALHQFHPETFSISRDQEFRIWMQSTNLPTRSSSIYGMALVAHHAKIPVKIVVGEREYDYPDYRFKRYKKVEIDDAKYTSKLFAKQARAEKIAIEEREFDLEEVKKILKDGKLVLLRVNAGIFRERKATSKYVLAYGCNANDSYMIMDPEQGQLVVEATTMEEAFQTLQTKKKRDHRMLILG